ncbi:hypothetical protein N7494_004601 [Penicillium frequentans]|uniref:BTB domain-containing protein n=1 Tax=Penicillium frequentans TaxID=3151616 RepID=A0AAD6D2Z7_9EURO|nr:hypothetical protein N7494_004601 [Penicillium glabrum]
MFSTRDLVTDLDNRFLNSELLTTMDPPQVQVPGSEQINIPSHSQLNSNFFDASNLTDVDMNDTQQTTEIDVAPEVITLPDSQPDPPKKKNTDKFLDFLTSPTVEIIVGQGEDKTVVTAHQTLLLESPFLNEFVGKFGTSGLRRILLPTENVEAFGCFLQFQYTRDYTVTQSEEPPNETEDSGEQLLSHALNGTPGGELAYARYVYTHTQPDDTTIRRPVASYWASRGHILRHDLEGQFKKLCIEVPEFAFDVLTIVMDRNEKNTEVDSSIRGSARKRLRGEK